ncbi:hypothetical protein BSM4216_0905 [Bacillus smithii]|nr:hypothetical protein BSM4216_0905 [Bacillus smithii]
MVQGVCLMYRKIVWNKKGIQSVKRVPSNKLDGIEKKEG